MHVAGHALKEQLRPPPTLPPPLSSPSASTAPPLRTAALPPIVGPPSPDNSKPVANARGPANQRPSASTTPAPCSSSTSTSPETGQGERAHGDEHMREFSTKSLASDGQKKTVHRLHGSGQQAPHRCASSPSHWGAAQAGRRMPASRAYDTLPSRV
jgi:hypothetical protein